MQFNSSFGAWLKRQRKALDLTQTELAEQVGYSVTTIRKIERNARRPSKLIMDRLADVLAVSMPERPAFTAFARGVSAQSSSALANHGFALSRHNLPIPLNTFVGRQRELGQISGLLTDPSCHLLTIVGLGGVGKTRLALQVALTQVDAFADGVYFVSLTAISTTEHLIATVAEALRFPFSGGTLNPKYQLLEFLRGKQLLLVLDNFEQLLPGTRLVSEILQADFNIKVLVTSRERLNIEGEQLVRLEGLDFPKSDAALRASHSQYGAMELFMQTARRVQLGFALRDNDIKFVSQICRLVVGMPLAIELAAAWVEILSVQEIAEEMQHGLNILETEKRDVPSRHRSLRATFDHSWKLLTEDERVVFKKLSVFRGGFTLVVAEQVAGASLKVLMALANKSFLRREATSEYYDIHELLRLYGEEKLSTSEQEYEQTRDSHCAYYAEFMRTQWSFLMSPQQKVSLEAIDSSFENVLEAWTYAIQRRKFPEIQNILAQWE